MASLEDYAKDELIAAGMMKEKGDMYAEYNKMCAEAVLELIRVFAKQGHSGMSAGITLGMFKRVAAFEPLTSLQGTDDEWNEIGENEYQNKRCGHVFKKNGQAYDSEGKVFRESNGTCWTKYESRVDIEFPYTPTKEYVDVEE